VRRNQRLKNLLHGQHEQARLHESALQSQLDLAQAKIHDLQLRMYGRKSERRWSVQGRARDRAVAPRPRGQQCGAPGHARTRLTHLRGREETVELDAPQCLACGAPLNIFPGTDASEVLQIDVRAYRRVILRQRYRCNRGCGVLPRRSSKSASSTGCMDCAPRSAHTAWTVARPLRRMPGCAAPCSAWPSSAMSRWPTRPRTARRARCC
jgi:hypothetical protein